jgi:hypothetical protein
MRITFLSIPTFAKSRENHTPGREFPRVGPEFWRTFPAYQEQSRHQGGIELECALTSKRLQTRPIRIPRS